MYQSLSIKYLHHCFPLFFFSLITFSLFVFSSHPQQARIWHRLPISWLPTGCYPVPHLLHCDCTLQLPLLQVPLAVSSTLFAPAVTGMPLPLQKPSLGAMGGSPGRYRPRAQCGVLYEGSLLAQRGRMHNVKCSGALEPHFCSVTEVHLSKKDTLVA